MTEEDTRNENMRKLKRATALLRALLVVFFLSIFGVLLFRSLQSGKKSILASLQEVQMLELSSINNSLQFELLRVENDIRYLAEPSIALPLLLQQKSNNLNFVEAIGKVQKEYEQIRYLDSNGMELVRVDFNPYGDAEVVVKSKLQYKGDRYYFTEAVNSANGDLYVSPLDLNKERGRVELPYKPMMRFVQRVYDNETFVGVVIINFRAQNLLNLIEKMNEHEGDAVYLVNSAGWYLYHANSRKTFGWMIEERKGELFSTEYSAAWSEMQKQGTYMYASKKIGELFFQEMHPAPHNHQIPYGKNTFYAHNAQEKELCEHTWHLVMRTSATQLLHLFFPIYRSHFLVLMIMGSVLTLMAWVLGKEIVTRKFLAKQLALAATHDPLTNLYNRKVFHEYYRNYSGLARRSGEPLSVLFIDVNNLKQVNDKQGHEAGDLMIKSAAEIMQKAVRDSDICTRIGGDEFLVLMPSCTSENAGIVASRVLESYTETGHVLKGENWSFSWGVSEYIESDTEESFVERADKEMYAFKQKFKSDALLKVANGSGKDDE